MVTGRTKLTTLAMIEMLRLKRQNNLQEAKFTLCDKVPWKSTPFKRISKFP